MADGHGAADSLSSSPVEKLEYGHKAFLTFNVIIGLGKDHESPVHILREHEVKRNGIRNASVQ